MYLVLATEDLGDLAMGWMFFVSLPLILVIAFLSGRLLGVRRSWTTSLLSGLIGWLAGASLSLVVARSDHGAGFTRNLLLFSTFFAMSASVWIELLAKPGALARAQTGLASIARPVRAVRRRSQRLSRYVQITRIAVRNGLGPSLGLSSGKDDDGGGSGAAPLAPRLRRALEECGGMFVKLGQVLSTSADLLPPAILTELSRLQDQATPADRAGVQALVEEELGASVDEVFAEFDWEPIAAASIGQAHRARLKSGAAVIVKIQRPGIADAVERDLQVLHELAKGAEARVPVAAEYRVGAHRHRDRRPPHHGARPA